MNINTKRLSCIEVTLEDTLGLLKCFNNPKVIKMLTLPLIKDVEVMERFLKVNYMSYEQRCEYPSLAIHYKDSNECIGLIEIHNENEYKNAQIGIYIQEEYWGLGIAKEAVEALVNYAFNTLGIHRLGMEIIDDNLNCIKLAKACGFTYEGTLKDYIFIANSYKNVQSWSIINKEKKDETIRN